MPVDAEDPVINGARRVLSGLARYHRHKVYGLEHIPAEGPALIAVNHSLATYDVGLLVLAVLNARGRMMRGLGDRSLFTTPGLRQVATRLGAVDADPDNALRLFDEGELVVVAPGGMREALRTREERYRIQWEDRRGFARLALRAGVPVILAACPRADDLFTAYRNPLTPRIYRRLKLPLPVARGLGPTTLPRPVALSHTLRAPISPPEGPVEANLTDFHAQLVWEMESLMKQALDRRL